MTTKDKVENRIRELVPELISQTIKDWIVEEKQASYGGIEIHLEHILMAIEKVENHDYYVWSNGFLCKEGKDIQGKLMECEEYYDLSKPFSDQSEELYSFLWSIIGIKNYE